MNYCRNVTEESWSSSRPVVPCPLPARDRASTLRKVASRECCVAFHCQIDFFQFWTFFQRSREESTSLKLWRIKGNSERKLKIEVVPRQSKFRNYSRVKKRGFRQRLGTLRTVKLYNALVLNIYIYIYYFRDFVSKYFSLIILRFTFMNIIQLCAILKYIFLVFRISLNLEKLEHLSSVSINRNNIGFVTDNDYFIFQWPSMSLLRVMNSRRGIFSALEGESCCGWNDICT